MTPDDTRRRLVLVTGATRSGTSTAAGTLQHLGLHVPQPVLKPNESNPRGFFESTWPIGFHRRLMAAADIGLVDARPGAFQAMADAVTPGARDELRTWLTGEFDLAPQLVIKDPRSLWVPSLWAETAADLGVEAGFLTMLRHPAEVMASRSTHYGGERDDVEAWKLRLRNLCYWINANLGLERGTRGRPRILIRYEDLLDDWRSVMRSVGGRFDLGLDGALDQPGIHPVDAFVDPTLRRHQPSWDGADMPVAMVELADAVWQALADLAAGGAVRDGEADDPAIEARLDTLAARYAGDVRAAEAIAHDIFRARLRADREARRSAPAGVAGTPPAGAAATSAAGPTSATTSASATGPKPHVEGSTKGSRLRHLVRRGVPASVRQYLRRRR